MTERPTPALGEIAALAEAALRARLGRGLSLARPRLLKDATRAVVVRCEAGGPAAPGPAVVVKLIRDDPATGFTEWAALDFLSGLPDAGRLAPAFLAGDAGARLFVIEDLGPGRTLEGLLAEAAPDEALAGLAALARQMARLHGATAGREEAFLAMRRALPADLPGRRREAEAWLAALGRARAWLDAAGCAAPPGLDEAAARVAAAYADPGPWLAFTHGDPAPSNNHFAGPDARLLDFEYGAFRHALYDITAWEVLCPLPRPAADLMRREFRAALAERLPAARDDRAFEVAWAELCAYRALAVLTWVPPAVIEADRPFVGPWTARQAVLAAVTRLARAAAPAPGLGSIAAAAAGLGDALRARWPELAARPDIATSWPALGG